MIAELSAGIESTTHSKDGTRLFYLRWPVENPRAFVAMIPGYADHAGRYRHVAAHLNDSGISAAVVDLRGHGRSAGRRGYVGRFDRYLEDIEAFLEAIQSSSMRIPLFILGHSMGGLVALNYMVHRPAPCKGLIVSSPFLGVAIRVPPIKIALGRLMSVIYPWLALPSGINPNDLSHDASVCNAYANDPLVFKTATARWFTEAMSSIEEVKLGAQRIQLPCLFLQAGDDRLADPNESEPLFNRIASPDKKFIRYASFFHEVFNEIENEKPLNDMTDWILKRC
jgi:alpha-beta hydrolase superfamily lysophospholipase